MRLMSAWIGLERLSLREVSRRLSEAGVLTSTGKARWDPHHDRTDAAQHRLCRGARSSGARAASRRRLVCGRCAGARIQRASPAPGSRCRAGSGSRSPRRPWSPPRSSRPPKHSSTRTAAAVGSCGAAPAGCCRGSWSAEGAATRSQARWLAGGWAAGSRPITATTVAPARTPTASQAKPSAITDRCAATAWSGPCGTRSAPSWRTPNAWPWSTGAGSSRPRGGPAPRRKAATLDRRIAALRRGIERLIDGCAEGLIDREEFEPRVEGMRRRLAHAEKERQTMAANAEAERDLTLLVGRLEEFAHKVHSSLRTLDWEGTREVVRAMVRRVEVDGDHVDVVFRVPPPSQPGSGGHPRGPTPPAGRVRQDCRGRHATIIRSPWSALPSAGAGRRPLLADVPEQPGHHAQPVAAHGSQGVLVGRVLRAAAIGVRHPRSSAGPGCRRRRRSAASPRGSAARAAPRPAVRSTERAAKRAQG